MPGGWRRIWASITRSFPSIPSSGPTKAAPVVAGDLASQPGGLADQNLQSRIRGALVMIRSNRHGWLPLATGNKSELAVGYCTLYGDMAGGFAVLCDVFKRDVYAVSRYINETLERREVIPANTLTKAPSAELAPNQFDQDTLPPYDLLDAILEGLIEREMSVSALSQQLPGRHRPLGGAAARPQRIQAAADAAGDQALPARLRQRPPHADGGEDIDAASDHAT